MKNALLGAGVLLLCALPAIALAQMPGSSMYDPIYIAPTPLQQYEQQTQQILQQAQQLAPLQSAQQTVQQCPAGSGRYQNSSLCLTPSQECAVTFGSNSVWGGGTTCHCATGYGWNSSGTSCVLNPQQVTQNLPTVPATTPSNAASGGVQAPACSSGFTKSGNACISYAQFCAYMGPKGTWAGNFDPNGTPSCGCVSGYKMSISNGTLSCIAVPVTPTTKVSPPIATIQSVSTTSLPVSAQVEQKTTVQPQATWWRRMLSWIGF